MNLYTNLKFNSLCPFKKKSFVLQLEQLHPMTATEMPAGAQE